jgi:hypothetical protein
MGIIIENRPQLLQTLGSIATSAADAAAEGIAEATRTDSKTVDTALKLFGGFDRNEFENINSQAPNLLVPAVRPPASYEGHAEYFKPLSNNMADQNLLVPGKDLLQQLEDPHFRMADGLSGFSDNRITQTLAQNKMSINAVPLDALGKLYMMEDTVGKQLQLHEQLDFAAFGRFAAPKQSPNLSSPKLNQGLKDLPDTQAAKDTSPPKILYTIEHALNADPQTKQEGLLMIQTLFPYLDKLCFEQGLITDGQLADLKESLGWISYAWQNKYPAPEWLDAAYQRFKEIQNFLKSLTA